MEFENVRLEHLGRGGIDGDVCLVDEVEAVLARLALLATDDRATGPGTCTIKIKVAKAGEDSVVLGYSVKVTEPPVSRKGLTAVIAGGDLVAVSHKQQPLPHIGPRAVEGTEK